MGSVQALPIDVMSGNTTTLRRRNRRACVGFALLLAGLGSAWADIWFSITGDPGDATVDTVQVAPDSVVVFSNLRVMKIRTSRAAPRQGFDGAPYRSYLSAVQIDCDNNEARFRKLELFNGPLWTGPSREVEYADADMPKMGFLDMQPNPAERIVQAACVVGKVQTR